MARKFTLNEIIPVAAHHDKTGEYPTEVLKKMWDAGLLNGHVPEKYGILKLIQVDWVWVYWIALFCQRSLRMDVLVFKLLRKQTVWLRHQ